MVRVSYPILKNSVGVTTGWAVPGKLREKAVLKEGTQVLEEPALSLSGLSSVQPLLFQYKQKVVQLRL